VSSVHIYYVWTSVFIYDEERKMKRYNYGRRKNIVAAVIYLPY
jgi:hypothetical protein